MSIILLPTKWTPRKPRDKVLDLRRRVGKELDGDPDRGGLMRLVDNTECSTDGWRPAHSLGAAH